MSTAQDDKARSIAPVAPQALAAVLLSPSAPTPTRQVSKIKAISEAFQDITVDAPNDLICAYIFQTRGLHVEPGLVQAVRTLATSKW